MSWVRDTVQAFGRSIGLTNLTLDDEGSLLLQTGDGGLVGIIDAHDDDSPAVIVYRSAPLSFAPERKFRRALHLTDFRRRRAWPIQVGAHDGLVTIAMRVSAREFTPPVLEQALTELTRLHASLDGRS